MSAIPYQSYFVTHLSLDENKISEESILKVEMVENGLERCLLIKNCKKEDFGRYSVRSGSDECSGTLSPLRNYFKRTENFFFLTKTNDDFVNLGNHDTLIR